MNNYSKFSIKDFKCISYYVVEIIFSLYFLHLSEIKTMPEFLILRDLNILFFIIYHILNENNAFNLYYFNYIQSRDAFNVFLEVLIQ